MAKMITTLCIILNAVSLILTGPLHRWTIELLELTSYTSDPDLVDLKFEIVRVGRGKFGFSGFLDIKVDLYDDAKIGGTLERSKYRNGPYSKFPMGVENETLSIITNKYYRKILQAEAQECCDNAPFFNTTFVVPLKKRYITINNCVLSTDNLPNVIMEGYYRVHVTLTGPVDVYVEALSLVENVIF